jgi:diacylglycerol kinase family enzyme
MTTSVEFMVDANETSLVVDTARAEAGDAVERITVAPVDGTPRFKVIVALGDGIMPRVMRAVMKALERSG